VSTVAHAEVAILSSWEIPRQPQCPSLLSGGLKESCCCVVKPHRLGDALDRVVGEESEEVEEAGEVGAGQAWMVVRNAASVVKGEEDFVSLHISNLPECFPNRGNSGGLVHAGKC